MFYMQFLSTFPTFISESIFKFISCLHFLLHLLLHFLHSDGGDWRGLTPRCDKTGWREAHAGGQRTAQDGH